ncbi:MAG: Uncharacterized protein G01um101413_276 [Parcubacteria group bacterium Gr01-1014_13]|nr:MAG: Uncharacterized protein G01um101413_276 [Parcubacteria group bacterium Gr01-1014_13]
MNTKTRRRKAKFRSSGKTLRTCGATLTLVAILYVGLLFSYKSYESVAKATHLTPSSIASSQDFSSSPIPPSVSSSVFKFGVLSGPKKANYYLNWEIPYSKITELAKWDLLILDMETQVKSLGALKKIRELNPDIIMLVYITPQEIKTDAASGSSVMRQKLAAGINESWYLTDIQNKKLTFWPGTWLLNVADNSPQINGIRLNKYMAQFVANDLLSTGLWDGVFFDNAWKDVKWLTGDSVDLNKDGQPDSDIDTHWQEGMRFVYNETRALTNNKYAIVGNATSDVYKNDLNGAMLESFPSFLGWQNSMRIYNSSESNADQPINIINVNTGNTGKSTDLKKFRFGLASTLLLGGFYSFDYGDQDHGQTWWYDEYDVRLGEPISTAVSLNNTSKFAEDVWRRDYQNGIVLVNPTSVPQEVDLNGEYEKITGLRDSSVNDGSVVSQVTLQPRDGLILLRTFQSLKNVVFANGNFVQFFDKTGNRVRNGLFVYDNDVPGGSKVYHGDLDGDGRQERIVAVGQKMEIFNTSGKLFSGYPFGRDHKGDLRIAVGKLANEDHDSLIVSQSDSGKIAIYNYFGESIKEGIFPLGKNYKAGLSTAIASENRVVVGTAGNRLPEVLIYDSKISKISKRFFVSNTKIKGALSIAVGDLDGDKNPEIITLLNNGKSKQVKVFNISGKLLSQFKVSTGFNSGASSVGTADVDFDGKDEIILMNG